MPNQPSNEEVLIPKGAKEAALAFNRTQDFEVSPEELVDDGTSLGANITQNVDAVGSVSTKTTLADKSALSKYSKVALNQITPTQKQLFLDYFYHLTGNMSLDLLNLVVSRDFFIIITLLAGETFTIPNIRTLGLTLDYVCIYNYCQSHGFTDKGYKRASKRFAKSEASIKAIVDKVKSVLEREPPDAQQEKKSRTKKVRETHVR